MEYFVPGQFKPRHFAPTEPRSFHTEYLMFYLMVRFIDILKNFLSRHQWRNTKLKYKISGIQLNYAYNDGNVTNNH